MDVVGEAGDGRTGVSMAEALAPDVVLMDVRMPGLDGIAATAQIVARRPETRVLILTTFDLDGYVYAALAAGASGFLLKDVSPEHLVAAIRLVSTGDALLAPSITRRLVERFAAAAPAPAKMATFSAALISTASFSTTPDGGTSTPGSGTATGVTSEVAGSSAMSPGSVMTETPLSVTACWIAACTTRGLCTGVEMSSE